MFTGIIEKSVRVMSVVDTPMFRRLTLSTGYTDLRDGESVAVNGVCLTVATRADDGVCGFDVIKETLEKTNLGLLNAGDDVHVERSLRVGDRVDGHFVQGHVDGTGRCVEQRSRDDEWRVVIEAPAALGKYLTPKGSISIDGVSLTLASVRGSVFEVALIPTTLTITRLGTRPVGWPFNLEMDVMSKTIVHFLEQRGV